MNKLTYIWWIYISGKYLSANALTDLTDLTDLPKPLCHNDLH